MSRPQPPARTARTDRDRDRDDVVRLDLGPSHRGDRTTPADRAQVEDEPPTAGHPARARLETLGLRSGRALVPVALVLLLVAVTAGPQPRPLPSGDDVRVTLTAGSLVPQTLDTLTVVAEVTNEGTGPVDVRALRLVGSGDAGVVVPPVTVPRAGRAALPVAARPDCSRLVEAVLALELGTPGGAASVLLRPAGTAVAMAELCPASEPGAHAAVTGSRTDPTGTGVEVRVVNRGTVRLRVGPTATGTGLIGAEGGGADAPAQPLLAGYPQLPVTLEPGQAAVVTLLPIVDPCATDAAAATLQADGPQGLSPVENQDVVRGELLAAAARLCGQRR